jgi:selenium metabolism protein YedF
MDFLDCKGKNCPVPVVETKRLLEGKEVGDLQVAVDNETSRENVKRFLESQGFSVHVEAHEGGVFLVRGMKCASPRAEAGETPQERKVLVFIDGETIGRGSEELGKILMTSFLNTLNELYPRPWRIIFINSGVKIPSEESPFLKILGELEGQGTELISCGTCLDYYGLKGKLKRGRVSNMYEIVSSFVQATNVIKP